ncbi:hypothetical protein HYU16_03510 [Candidatus Woesearchaeota archaeon]|nr:hypothetical protein [Candidatus Woesearchaeota archaeon]
MTWAAKLRKSLEERVQQSKKARVALEALEFCVQFSTYYTGTSAELLGRADTAAVRTATVIGIAAFGYGLLQAAARAPFMREYLSLLVNHPSNFLVFGIAAEQTLRWLLYFKTRNAVTPDYVQPGPIGKGKECFEMLISPH